jgi:hypothetical protein
MEARTGRLFYDDEFQALRDVVELGHGYPKTAGHLWPGMKPESAYAKLKACCNEHGDQRLKFREYIAVMIFNERFDVLYFASDECSHTRPIPRAPADEEAKLAQVIESAGDTLERALKALDNVRRRNLRTA